LGIWLLRTYSIIFYAGGGLNKTKLVLFCSKFELWYDKEDDFFVSLVLEVIRLGSYKAVK